MRKILYSPGYGAGWSSWSSGKVARLMLEYKPIVEALERGESMILEGKNKYSSSIPDEEKYHPAIIQLIEECKKLGENYVCVLGADKLSICPVEDGELVKIDEYDGSESVIRLGHDDSEWM